MVDVGDMTVPEMLIALAHMVNCEHEAIRNVSLTKSKVCNDYQYSIAVIWNEEPKENDDGMG